MNKKRVKLPLTLDAAVRLLNGLVPEGMQAQIAYMSEDQLSSLHMGLGRWIRDHLGLWGANPELLAATGESNADDGSAVIVKALWEKLRDELPKVH
jgi:hypothetical protein